MQVPRTTRKPGDANEAELKAYQVRHGLLIDGICGNQTIGQFFTEIAHWKRLAMMPAPAPRPWGWMLACAGLALALAAALAA